MLSRIIQRSAIHTRSITSQVLRQIGAPRPFSTVLPDLPTPMNAKDGSRIEAWTKQDELEKIQDFKGHIQPKLDGWRVMLHLHTCTFVTKGGKQIVPADGSTMHDAIQSFAASIQKSDNGTIETQWIDGELMHADGRDRLQHCLVSTDVTVLEDITFNAFDLVNDCSFEQRHSLLQKAHRLNRENESIRLVPTERFHHKGTISDLKEVMVKHGKEFAAMGHEGAMLRLDPGVGKIDKGYQGGMFTY